MSENIEAPIEKSWWQRRNWWKIGFFILLFVFEVSREIIVIQADAAAMPNVNFNIFRYEGFTSVAGVWKRTDNDKKMAPNIIKIECYQSRGACTIVDTHMDRLWVFAPDISNFNAEFTPEGITFDDDSAQCVTLKFRVDLKLEKVNAMRKLKPNSAKNKLCNKLEERVDLTLADADYSQVGIDTHFLPILSTLKAVFS